MDVEIALHKQLLQLHLQTEDHQECRWDRRMNLAWIDPALQSQGRLSRQRRVQNQVHCKHSPQLK